MKNTDFEGYQGIYLNNMTVSNDVMLLIVLILLSAFAWVFLQNTPLFGKMLSNISAGEQRQSIFETTERDSFFFNTFMRFQTLLLCSIFIFCCAVEYQFIPVPSGVITCLIVCVLFLFLFLFYLLKQAIYAIFGYIFLEQSTYKMMFTNYQALFSTWGVFLYIPVLWLLLIGNQFHIAIILLIFSYLIFRLLVVFKFIYIFFNKNTGFLLLILYLCGQELIPMVFLYEGLIYIYNIIDTNNIWQ